MNVRWLSGVLLCLVSGFSWGQTSFETGAATQPVHWAFAPLVGMGWYDVEGGRSAFIIGAAPRQTLRRSSPGNSLEKRIGINIRYDATLGLYRLNDIFEFTDTDNVSTLSFTPGVEFEVPITERWGLRAFANFGWGTALDDGDSAWIWYTGIKSRYRPDIGRGELALLNGAWYAGFSPDSGASDDLAAIFAGVEFRHGLPRPRWYGQPLDLVWHLGYTYLADPAEFVLQGAELTSIGDTVELGMAFARRDRPFRILGLEVDRVGLTYSLGENGDFGSLTLNLESWFAR